MLVKWPWGCMVEVRSVLAILRVGLVLILALCGVSFLLLSSTT